MPVPDAATDDPTDPAVQKSWLSEGQTLKERWYAAYELRTVFMHDHHFAVVHAEPRHVQCVARRAGRLRLA